MIFNVAEDLTIEFVRVQAYREEDGLSWTEGHDYAYYSYRMETAADLPLNLIFAEANPGKTDARLSGIEVNLFCPHCTTGLLDRSRRWRESSSCIHCGEISPIRQGQIVLCPAEKDFLSEIHLKRVTTDPLTVITDWFDATGTVDPLTAPLMAADVIELVESLAHHDYTDPDILKERLGLKINH